MREKEKERERKREWGDGIEGEKRDIHFQVLLVKATSCLVLKSKLML